MGQKKLGDSPDQAKSRNPERPLGSVEVVTDAQGKKVETASYMPFGGIQEGDQIQSTDIGFTRQQYDADTGLHYYHSRYYDPMIGRFVMADRIIPDPGSPQSLNPYSYCHNDPLNFVDPSGHERHRNDDLWYPDLTLAGSSSALVLLPETSPGTISAVAASFSALTNGLAAYGRGSGMLGIASHTALVASFTPFRVQLATRARRGLLQGFSGTVMPSRDWESRRATVSACTRIGAMSFPETSGSQCGSLPGSPGIFHCR